MRPLAIALLLGLATMPPAAAYLQNNQLELDLRKSDPKALALFPAKGFRDGAAGFFTTNELYVVPGSERVWCQDQSHGVLETGCYVEFFFQGKGLKPTNSQGDSCGLIGRWYRAPGTKNYVPTAGAFFSKAIANDDSEAIDSALDGQDLRQRCR